MHDRDGWMGRITSVGLLAVAVTLAPSPVSAQSSPHELALGLSRSSYLFEPGDVVYTDTEAHRKGTIGFRVTKAFFGDRSFGWLIDTELYFGRATRSVLDAELSNTIVGLRSFVGPVVSLGRLQAYGAVGLNRTTVGESDTVVIAEPAVGPYVASDEISQAWSDVVAARARDSDAGEDVSVTVPGYGETKAAGLLGASYDFGGPAGGVRLSVDYIGLFMTPVRNSLRITLSLAG